MLHETIRAWVKEHPDATIGEVQAWLLRSHQVSASSGLICETLALLGLTRKKVAACRRAGPPGCGCGTSDWRESQRDLDPRG